MEEAFIILAAGKGSRIYPFIKKHKSLIKVNGKTLIENHIEGAKLLGFNKLIIVLWHHKDEIKTIIKKYDDINIVENRLLSVYKNYTKYGISLYYALKNIKKVKIIGYVMADHYIDYKFLKNIINMNTIKQILDRYDMIAVVDSNPLVANPNAHSKFLVNNEKILDYGKSLPRWTHLDTGLFFSKFDTLYKYIVNKRLFSKDFDTTDLLDLKIYLLDLKGNVRWFGVNTIEDFIFLRNKGIQLTI